MATGGGVQSNTWVNGDGLVVKFGAEEGTSQDFGGSYRDGQQEVVSVIIDCLDLTEVEVVVNHAVRLPKNAYITNVRVHTLIAMATGTAIDVGTAYYSGTTLTALDADGILEAHITASSGHVGEIKDYFTQSDGSGHYNVLDGTGAAAVETGGNHIGTSLATTAFEYYITASMTDSTSFTTGQLMVEIMYIPEGITLYA